MPNLLATIQRLENPSEAEVAHIVSVLVAAFQDDTFVPFLVGGDMTLLGPKFEANVRAAAVGGAIYVAILGPQVQDIVGAAILLGPGQGSRATGETRNPFLAMISDELRAWWRDIFIPITTRLSEESLGPGFKEQQWHLLLFGVAPEHHRKGYGKSLMVAVENMAKTDGLSIVLETATDTDLIIYGRMGFKVMGETRIISPAVGESPIYQMLKTP